MASNGISMEPDIALYPYPLPGTGQGPFYARVILSDAFSVFDSRQPSSVWKNTRILQPLASGWLLLRTTVRSKALSLMESWSAAAITSSLISHWSHFQVRPVQSPGFWEQVSRYLMFRLDSQQNWLATATQHNIKIRIEPERWKIPNTIFVSFEPSRSSLPEFSQSSAFPKVTKCYSEFQRIFTHLGFLLERSFQPCTLPYNREAWRAAVHGVAKSGTGLKGWTITKAYPDLFLSCQILVTLFHLGDFHRAMPTARVTGGSFWTSVLL